jgi:hypothetical protein
MLYDNPQFLDMLTLSFDYESADTSVERDQQRKLTCVLFIKINIQLMNAMFREEKDAK